MLHTGKFELLLIFIFDGVIGALLLPLFRKKISHHQSDDQKIADLEKSVKDIRKYLKI